MGKGPGEAAREMMGAGVNQAALSTSKMTFLAWLGLEAHSPWQLCDSAVTVNPTHARSFASPALNPSQNTTARRGIYVS